MAWYVPCCAESAIKHQSNKQVSKLNLFCTKFANGHYVNILLFLARDSIHCSFVVIAVISSHARWLVLNTLCTRNIFRIKCFLRTTLIFRLCLLLIILCISGVFSCCKRRRSVRGVHIYNRRPLCLAMQKSNRRWIGILVSSAVCVCVCIMTELLVKIISPYIICWWHLWIFLAISCQHCLS